MTDAERADGRAWWEALQAANKRLREYENDNPGFSERSLAVAFVESASDDEIRGFAVEHAVVLVGNARRARARAAEQEAQRRRAAKIERDVENTAKSIEEYASDPERVSERERRRALRTSPSPLEVKREEREKKLQAKRDDEAAQKLAREREEAAARRAEAAKAREAAWVEAQGGEDVVRGWILDPASYPFDVREGCLDRQITHRHGPGRPRTYTDNDNFTFARVFYRLAPEEMPPSPRGDTCPNLARWAKQALRAQHPETEYVSYGYFKLWGDGMYAMSSSIDDTVEEYVKQNTLALTEKFLATEVRLGGGRRTTWGECTLEEHKSKAESLLKHGTSVVETASRHRIAIEMITAAGVNTLQEVAA